MCLKSVVELNPLKFLVGYSMSDDRRHHVSENAQHLSSLLSSGDWLIVTGLFPRIKSSFVSSMKFPKILNPSLTVILYATDLEWRLSVWCWNTRNTASKQFAIILFLNLVPVFHFSNNGPKTTANIKYWSLWKDSSGFWSRRLNVSRTVQPWYNLRQM